MNAHGDWPLRRGLYAQRLFPGTEATFERLCRSLPDELIDESIAAGVSRSAVFRRGTDVWSYGEYEGDPRAIVERMARSPSHRRWRHTLRDIVVDADGAGAPLFYDEVFHTDAGPELGGPMSPGMFSLVIDPDRSAEYDAMHADPWPELLDALAGSGFRDYSGFRRGPHVIYYGEFYPAMRTAFERMSRHEVDARWGAAFAGIITTIRGADSWLLTAEQVCQFGSEGLESTVAGT